MELVSYFTELRKIPTNALGRCVYYTGAHVLSLLHCVIQSWDGESTTVHPVCRHNFEYSELVRPQYIKM
jgi:hypothetical protein